VAGQLFYRSDTDRIYKYDGASWEELTTDSGLYTPTLYNETNIAASTAYQGMWARIGSLVIFSGTVAIDVTVAGAFVLGISVPVSSAFTDVGQASGVGNNLSSEVARVFANVVNANRIRFQGNTAVTTNYAWSYMMIYTIV
jgi:hypothetical protein